MLHAYVVTPSLYDMCSIVVNLARGPRVGRNDPNTEHTAARLATGQQWLKCETVRKGVHAYAVLPASNLWLQAFPPPQVVTLQ